MRVIIQSYNDVAAVREIGAMCHGASIVVVEHGDARHEFPTLTRPNVGRDYGAFIWYIVNNYEALEGSESYVFTSANLDKHDRRKRLRERLRPGYAPSALMNRPRRSGTVDAAFACDFYQTRQGRRSLAPASPRPFGNWFEAHVGSMRTFYQSGEYANGLVVTDARTLRSRPRAFWEGLLAQLSTDNAPEAGHFVEKASAFLFHPSRTP